MSELIALILEEADENMNKAVSHARSEFATVRTGRASSALVEKLMVDYHGTDVAMQQLASFTVPEANQLVIAPFDKSAIGGIEKAIHDANLGLTPSNDGVVMRLIFPMLTEERRHELVRMVKAMAEESRVGVRNARRAARHDLDGLEKAGDASKDDVLRAEKDLDQMTHDHEAAINAALDQKEQELLEV